MSVLSHKKKGGRERRFSKRQMLWDVLPAGGHYPFGLRADKAAVMLLVGSWAELGELYEVDYRKASEAGLKDIQARLLMEQGELEGWRNRHRRAGELLELADRTYRELNDSEGRFRCENGLAVVYINLGEYEKAEKLIDSSTAQARRLRHRDALCSFLNSHAVLCKVRKQPDRAIKYLEERMAISIERGAAGDVASSHLNLAVVYSEKAQYHRALEHNEAAIALSQKMGDVMQQHYALFNQAQILMKLGRTAECLGFLKKALAVSRHLGDGETEELILREAASIEEKQGPGP
jgi:tetratricopeptide (TPR) repeat protein